MIKTIRRKFIAIAMLSMLAVLAVIVAGINIINYQDICYTADAKLSMLAASGGTFGSQVYMVNVPEDVANEIADAVTGEDDADSEESSSDKPTTGAGSGDYKTKNKETSREDSSEKYTGGFLGIGQHKVTTEETPFNTRYFTVTFDEDGGVSSVNTSYIAAVSASEAQAYANELLEKGKTDGFVDDYKYTTTEVVDSSGDSYTMYIFLDCTQELDSFESFLFITIGISLIGTLAVFFIILFLSNIAIRPVQESYAKQKRFITDASHEIKTPLAIIDANTEVIEMESGESEWTISIRRQIARLTSLTEKLVFLSRMDEEGAKLNMIDFCLSNAINETIESFTGVFEAKGKNFTAEIPEGVMLHGDEGNIKQMMSLLIDNAIKYADENGQIKVTLKEIGKNKVITVFNTADNVEQGDLSMLFERFYRSDKSRNSKTGGHGIGLSVVHAIVTAHKGKITAESKDGKSIIFTITL